jgi:hypothetical protein|tara:strand:- start:1145 stop:1972 length:828 start_codon:yes stop_codon:yes gene_type:complete
MVIRTIKLLDDTAVTLQRLDPRRIRLFPLSPGEEIKDVDGTINSVDYGNGDFSITIGSVIEVGRKSKYKVDSIQKVEGTSLDGYYLIINTLTRSSQLIMPFLGNTRKAYAWGKNFSNCFIGTEKKGDYALSIYLLYRWEPDIDFVKFEKEMLSHDWYISQTDPDLQHVMYEFKIPDGHEDISRIIKGEYSLISPKGKTQILKFHGAPADGRLAKVFSKDLTLREELIIELSETERVQLPYNAELMSTFTPEKEVYLEKYRITIKKNSDDAVNQVW